MDQGESRPPEGRPEASSIYIYIYIYIYMYITLSLSLSSSNSGAGVPLPHEIVHRRLNLGGYPPPPPACLPYMPVSGNP